MTNPDITLYTCPTPNGFKISTVLEELGLPYKTQALDLHKSEQKQEYIFYLSPLSKCTEECIKVVLEV